MYLLKKENLKNLLKVWEKDFKVLAPSKSGGDVILSPYDEKTFTLDYINFTLPPKEFFFEMREILFEWQKNEDGSVEVKHPDYNFEPKILFGVRACDAYGIAYMDKFFGGTFEDTNYLERRKNTCVVALNCTKSEKDCFCTSTNTGPFAVEGADLIFTPFDEEYLIEATTPKGEELMSKSQDLFIEADATKADEKASLLVEVKSKFSTTIDLDDVKDLLERNFDHPIWSKMADYCVSCHGCTFTCPTCTCFNVVEEMKNKNAGTRYRCWDTCQASYFTRNAGDHNPRDDKSKFRYRIYDKFKYIHDKFDMKGCVGCGRCIKSCLAHISMVEIIKELKEDEEKKKKAKEEKPRPCSIYVPQIATIKEIHEETDSIKTFVVQYNDKSLHENYEYRGQFFEITLFGVGEIAISIPWAPSNKENFEFCIKKAGKVTTAIHNLKVGDQIGLRGPFGTGFPMDELESHDLLFVGSGVGMAPIRTVILHALENREKFGKIKILSRSMKYEDLIYKNDLKEWSKIDGVEVFYLLAKPTDEIEVYDGKMEQLISELDLNWSNTKAIICASPKRIKLLANDLMTDFGMKDTDILTTLETHMRCGVGKCGHCKVGDKYMCVDGPVFNYKEMLELPQEY